MSPQDITYIIGGTGIVAGVIMLVNKVIDYVYDT